MFLLLLENSSFSQSAEDLSTVRVEELTDGQVRKFLNEVNRFELNDSQIEQFVLQRGMNQVEVVKLKQRIQSIRKTGGYTSPKKISGSASAERTVDSISALEQKPLADYAEIFSSLKSRNFGYDVFNNSRIVFEPNLSIPTPENYVLAASDELVIDVSGNSEATYRLKISPEGVIKIPIAGPINLNGLTIEQAKNIIQKKLANTIYSSIKSGRTRVAVTLGSIRSIKVTVIGEAVMPGTYTLPSLASAFHALYAAGGPNGNGSYRNILVIRNNKTVSTIDIYDYLSTGSKKNDIRLMDQDIIKINTYSVRIELKGEVKRPGLYDVSNKETLADILEFAGGFTDNAYSSRIQVFKNTQKERKVTTISEEEMKTLIPGKGDSYIIGKILNRFINRISIGGAIYRPGEYELKEGMTLTKLISEADGVREDAFLSRGIIHRLKEDLNPEIISFDLEKINGGQIADISLRKEDRIVVYSKFDLKEGYYVMINGEVSAPGIFLYEDGMRVQDLVLMAGGLKESSSLKRIEISRRIKDSSTVKTAESKTAIILQQEISSDLKDTSTFSQLQLLPFDEVVVRTAPGYYVQKNVVIEGEVNYTGKYSLEAKNDRISDLIKRSGGITPEAYLKGAVLVRTRNFSKTEQTNYELGLKNLVKENLNAGTPIDILKVQVQDIIQKKSDFVGIDLQKILENPQSEFDLFLNDGDTLRIPKLFQTVRVNGEVLYPTLVPFSNRMKFKSYILSAGGFSERSSKKKSYVIYPNGSVAGTKHFLFFKNYPSLSPGSEIYVPLKREKERLRTGEVITIGATVVSMLAILVSLIK
ncbi:MAG: SLBB domain-containing protein [Chitinophagaceae bacterium]